MVISVSEVTTSNFCVTPSAILN